MHSVKSSNIEQIGHDGMTMRVKFRNGNTYEYGDISKARFTEFLGAESVGSHFHKMKLTNGFKLPEPKRTKK